MLTHNINPVLLKLGFLEIRYYGLVYALGFIFVYLFLNKNRKRLKISKDKIETLVLWLIVGLFIGARLFHFIFTEPLFLIRKPWEFFMIWHGGMSFFGGLVGAFLCTYLYIRKLKLNWKLFGDIIVIPAIIALTLGRIANFINAELVGIPSNLPWCVVFPFYDAVCRHPYQLYAALSHLILFGVLLFMMKKKFRDGVVFYSFLAGYGLLRFITDFFRQDPRFIGLTVWQYMSIVILILGVVLIVKSIKQTKKIH